jgi:hypothetical protein
MRLRCLSSADDMLKQGLRFVIASLSWNPRTDLTFPKRSTFPSRGSTVRPDHRRWCGPRPPLPRRRAPRAADRLECTTKENYKWEPCYADGFRSVLCGTSSTVTRCRPS